MTNQKKVLAIIPARGGSKGLPGKNSRLLHGMPLVAWPIKAALNARCVSRVVVTTDDPKLASIAKEYGADVPFLRPSHLAKDESPSSDAILHALNFCTEQDGEYDYLITLEPTSPLTESLDVDQAFNALVASDALSIVGASSVGSAHPAYCAFIGDDKRLKPFNRSEFGPPLRRQAIEPLYFFDGSLYISDVKKYKETATFYHESTLPYVVPAWKSLEIDTLLDFLMVETVMHHKMLLKSEFA